MEVRWDAEGRPTVTVARWLVAQVKSQRAQTEAFVALRERVLSRVIAHEGRRLRRLSTPLIFFFKPVEVVYPPTIRDRMRIEGVVGRMASLRSPPEALEGQSTRPKGRVFIREALSSTEHIAPSPGVKRRTVLQMLPVVAAWMTTRANPANGAPRKLIPPATPQKTAAIPVIVEQPRPVMTDALLTQLQNDLNDEDPRVRLKAAETFAPYLRTHPDLFGSYLASVKAEPDARIRSFMIDVIPASTRVEILPYFDELFRTDPELEPRIAIIYRYYHVVGVAANVAVDRLLAHVEDDVTRRTLETHRRQAERDARRRQDLAEAQLQAERRLQAEKEKKPQSTPRSPPRAPKSRLRMLIPAMAPGLSLLNVALAAAHVFEPIKAATSTPGVTKVTGMVAKIGTWTYETHPDDTMRGVAKQILGANEIDFTTRNVRKFFEAIERVNPGIDLDTLRIGQKVTMPDEYVSPEVLERLTGYISHVPDAATTVIPQADAAAQAAQQAWQQAADQAHQAALEAHRNLLDVLVQQQQSGEFWYQFDQFGVPYVALALGVVLGVALVWVYLRSRRATRAAAAGGIVPIEYLVKPDRPIDEDARQALEQFGQAVQEMEGALVTLNAQPLEHDDEFQRLLGKIQTEVRPHLQAAQQVAQGLAEQQNALGRFFPLRERSLVLEQRVSRSGSPPVSAGIRSVGDLAPQGQDGHAKRNQ
jgi:hypothetical protein